MRRTIAAVCIALVALAPMGGAFGQAAPDEDAANMIHSLGRLRDMYTNVDMTVRFQTEMPSSYLGNLADQLQHPTEPILTLGQLIPGATNADPYRLDWEKQGRGIQVPFEYRNRYNARITGNLWAPATGARHPGIVITTGSIQGYEEMYLWAAQGLAEAGYIVMTYDVQGQGQSETFGHNDDGSLWCNTEGCPGVPFQQDANFVEGTEDALDWFLSESNPLRARINEKRLGLAGHSLGAAAVTNVGNSDKRIDAVVAWDNANLSEEIQPRVPTMGQNADYFFNPTPATSAPAADSKNATYRRFVKAGVDSMQVALYGSTHLEWTYVPYILPASSEGERVAMYYTLAWFDRYLKRGPARRLATRRLVATAFDGSADSSAIGAGAYDPATLRNVPHAIEDDKVADHLSIYYRSSYSFGTRSCEDMKSGC